jgi:predicted enzyme related to lactoylglutathione lyase
MLRSEPMLAVRNVKASVVFYKSLLGCRNDHDIDEYDRLLDGENVILTLHAGSADEHGMRAPAEGTAGAGVLIWIYVSDLDAVHARAKSLKATIAVAPHVNPRAGWRELTLEDPDGYRIGLIEADG